MRIVLQRVTRAEVSVTDSGEASVAGSIGRGLVALCAIERDDDDATVEKAVYKLSRVRCFEDRDGKMNLDTAQAGGAFLLVSQFTLAARLDRGHRPSFGRAAPPSEAERLLVMLADGLRAEGHSVAVGRFGAHMQVSLVNDGPVTLILEI